MKRNIYLIVAAINVYGIDIYGRLYLNTESGKGNLKQVLAHRMSLGQINRTVAYLIKEGLLNAEQKHSGEGKLFSMGCSRNFIKSYLKLVMMDL